MSSLFSIDSLHKLGNNVNCY